MTYDHQIWQAGTPRRVDSNETNQAGAGDAVTSKARDRLKTFHLNFQSAYGYQTCQDGNLPSWSPTIKVT